MPHRFVKTSSLVVFTLTSLVFNPLLLQGCFFRCPEPRPFIHNLQPLQSQLIEMLKPRITPSNKEGLLEITVTDPRLSPNYKWSSLSWRLEAPSLVQPAYAMASCPSHEAPPQLRDYTVSAKLSVVWIPVNGDAITLVEGLAISGQAQGSLNALDNTLTMRSAASNDADARSWHLKFTQYNRKYIMQDIQTTSASQTLIVRANSTQVVAFERSQTSANTP